VPFRALSLTALAGAISLGTAPLDAQTLVALPTRFVSDRFFVTPVTTRGDTLLLFTDSGGGGPWVIRPVLERLGGTPRFLAVEDGDSVFSGGKFPTFKPGASIPTALGQPDGSLIGFGTKAMPEMEGAVGMLGQRWFAGRVWVVDYPGKQLSVYDTPPAPIPFGEHTIPMTLKKPPQASHPRIRVLIDGDTIDMLLDTGATSQLTPTAVRLLGGGPEIRASSFVAQRLTDRWRAKHPEWRIIARGEVGTGSDLIEVPNVNVAGYDVGPVWFAMRTNAPYDNMMKQLMDRPILASLGGNAFRSFRLTMDYPNQRVTFER
jgi:hypothetical protein